MTQVLIAEDDEKHADIIAKFLEIKGLTCKIVYSGNAAIEWLEINNCELVITDMRMPFGTGIDLMQWNMKKGPNVPVIAISGDIDSENESKQFCEVMGVPYVPKPLDLAEFSEMIADQLG